VRVHDEYIDHVLELPEHPERIVSLSSGFTETLFTIGAAEQVAGVSAYCRRYIDTGDRVIVVSDITKGRNLIHDGPSLLDTSRWLQNQMMKL